MAVLFIPRVSNPVSGISSTGTPRNTVARAIGGAAGPLTLIPSGGPAANLGNAGGTGVGQANQNPTVFSGVTPVAILSTTTGIGQVAQTTPQSLTAPNASTSYGTVPTNTNGFGAAVPTVASTAVASQISSLLPSNLSPISLLLIAAVIFLVVME
jgi:hypothetical protein